MPQVLKEKKQLTVPQLSYFCCEVDQCIISALSVTELFKVKTNEVLGQSSVSSKDTHEGVGQMFVFCKGNCLLLQ